MSNQPSSHTDREGSPDSVSADLEMALSAVKFPANKDSIVNTAQQVGADAIVSATLDSLPERDYSGPDDVMKALEGS